MANARGCGDGGVLSGESDGEGEGGRVSVIYDCEFGRVLEAEDRNVADSWVGSGLRMDML